jgi:hypothetical protein
LRRAAKPPYSLKGGVVRLFSLGQTVRRPRRRHANHHGWFRELREDLFERL